MQYGKQVFQCQVDYIVEHLHLPHKETILGIYTSGYNALLIITSARLINLYNYQFTTEIYGSNIADATIDRFFGLTIRQRKSPKKNKWVKLSIKKEEREGVLALVKSIQSAPTPVMPIIQKENEKWALGIRVKMQKLGTKEERKAINQQVLEETKHLKIKSEPNNLVFAKSHHEATMLDRQAQQELYNDRVFVIAALIDLIKEHWLTLSMRNSQLVRDDGYKNYQMDGWLKELVYFRDNVVMPKLERVVYTQTTNQHLGKILLMFIASSEDLPKNGLEYGDDSNKLARALLDSPAMGSDTLGELAKNMWTDLDDIALEIAYNEIMSMRLDTLLKVETTNAQFDIGQYDILTLLIFSLCEWLGRLRKKDSLTEPADEKFMSTNPYDYEKYIAKRLTAMGFTAQPTQRSGDYGVDVLAEKNGKSFAIQCKLYTGQVGIHAVQEIHAGQVYYRADHAAVITNSGFTPAAKKLAATSHVLLLNDNNLESLNILADNHHAQKPDTPRKPLALPTSKSPKMDDIRRPTRQETDELITVILPTIQNDK